MVASVNGRSIIYFSARLFPSDFQGRTYEQFFSTMNAICIYGNIREKNSVPTVGKYFRAEEDDDDSEKIIKLNVMSFHQYQAYMYFSSSPTQTYK